jgi:hypothetical protein
MIDDFDSQLDAAAWAQEEYKPQEPSMGTHEYRKDGRSDFGDTVSIDCIRERNILLRLMGAITHYNDIDLGVNSQGFRMLNHCYEDESNDFQNELDAYWFSCYRDKDELVTLQALFECKVKPPQYASAKWLHVKQNCVKAIINNRACLVGTLGTDSPDERTFFMNPDETKQMLESATFEPHFKYKGKPVTRIYEDDPHISTPLVYSDPSRNSFSDIKAFVKAVRDASDECSRKSLTGK